MPNDTTKSDWELIEEYSRIVTLTERPELAFRVQEILDELRKRSDAKRPGSKKVCGS
jgi:hypothetical protein